MLNPSIRLSADIGGTFTDLVVDTPSGRFTRKVLTTIDRPERGLMDGARALLADAQTSFDSVAVLVHGTTLATNAILERKGARTALVTTDGFRDVLEIGSEGRFDQYDLQIERPRPLVSREWRFTVPERVDAQGCVRLPLDPEALTRLVPLLREEGIESVAISFLHAYANPAHEREAGRLLAQALPHLSISLSSDVCPEIREYERTSTVVGNAYVKPLIDGYLSRMEAALAEVAFSGRLYLVTSGGGITSLQTARQFPIRLVESGPAGGAIYAASRARELAIDRAVAFDMGGTTAKICLIRDGQPTTANSFEVDRTHRFLKGSGLPLRIPAVELVEIGAGGGSIAKVDRLDRVVVGPESAGSQPGPACYPDGGSHGTVTDADLTLGLLDPENFADGRILLRRDAAAEALDRAVGDRLGLSAEMAAYAVFQTVCESMASAVRVHAAERGEAIADFTMVASGGAAPLHAASVAEKVGVQRVVIPPNAGVGSAVGFLEAPLAFELIRSRHMVVDTMDTSGAAALLQAMSREARALLDADVAPSLLSERCTAFMRYVGQGHEIAVGVTPGADALSPAGMRAAFEQCYGELFSRFIPDAAIEVLSWSVLVSVPIAEVATSARPAAAAAARAGGSRRFYDGTRACWAEIPVYSRSELPPGASMRGPAIIVEAETSTFVTAAFDAEIDGNGCIILQRRAREGQADADL